VEGRSSVLSLIARTVAEPLMIDFPGPASYRHDRSRLSLAGLLPIDCPTGLMTVVILATRPPVGLNGTLTLDRRYQRRRVV
jgi:hypothetical protein